MVATTYARYMFQSILVKGNILAYCSFFEKISPMKRVCPFKTATVFTPGQAVHNDDSTKFTTLALRLRLLKFDLYV